MADAAAAPDRVGSLVDKRYKLLEMMASGAMGSVYKGERVPVGKIVAVKFLHASFANDSEFQARFERETRIMSKLAHPNCVSVLDFGVWENAPYLVMDYVAGTTLRARMDKGPIAPAQALAIARQIAAGLAHAHEQGVFHRDIKPANIMITDEIGHGERVRILDFGLARLRSGSNAGRDATQTNMVVGTPNYMAPEQTVPAGTIDARTDVYALGVVLFEMVAGERPFSAEDTLQLLGMHRAAPIPRLADKVSDELPDGLQQIVDTAMAKSPADRYQTAIDLANAIDDVIGVRASSPVIITPKRHNTAAVGAASTMLQVEVDAEGVQEPRDQPPTRSRFWRTMIGAMILVGGAAAMAGYLIRRNASEENATFAHDRGAVAVVESHADAGAQRSVTPDAAIAVGSGDGEIEMDPSVAEDLDPEAKGSAATAVDEAENAPKTTAEAETHEVATPPATTLAGAVQLIKDGKRDLALTSLRVLRQKSPKSSYIPFLLGNLYFDQRWWSVSMDDYTDAIKKDAAYRTNPTINRNVIRMLSSPKTRQRAANFLRGTIGHPAGTYLKYAAVHEPNDDVRKQAAMLARAIR